MNQPKKITPAKVRIFTLTLLGIAASVGIASGLYVEPRPQISHQQSREWVVWIKAPAPSASPAPAPKKSLQEGYERIKCDKCGQEYDAPSVGCWRLLELEEIKHLHLSPQTEARMIKNFNARQEVIKYPRDLGNGVVEISKNVTMTKKGGEVFYHFWRD